MWYNNTIIVDIIDPKNATLSSDVIVKIKDKKIIGLSLSIRGYEEQDFTKEEVIRLFESLGKLTTLVELHIHHIYLSFVPESIINLKSLNNLSLRSCGLMEFDNLHKLTNLKHLKLQGNYLSNLTNIWELKELVELNLSNNKFEKLPEGFNQLNKLKILILDNIKFTGFPLEIIKLHNLEELSLSSCDLSLIPEQIGNLQSLKDLTLDYNKISAIPNNIANLQLLTSLNLQENCIKELPATFMKLTKLQKLNLSSNQIEKLPYDFGQLQNLDYLNLSNNPLNEVPTSFANLTQLTSINTKNTNIQNVPIKHMNTLVDLDKEHTCKNCGKKTLGIIKFCSNCDHETGIKNTTLEAYYAFFALLLPDKTKNLYQQLDQKQRDGIAIFDFLGIRKNIGWSDNDKDFEDSVDYVNVKIENGNVVSLEINDIWDFDTKVLNEILWYFQNLKYLAVDNMKLDFVPRNIERMRELEFLRIQILSSDVEELPEFLKMNKNLKGYVSKHKLGET